MRQVGLSGLTRVKRGRTTIRVPGVRVADDLVERRFRPDRPDVLWVADITYLRTWEGWGLPRRRPGRLQPPDRRLVDGRSHARRARRRRARDGAAPPPADARPDSPFRPQIAIRRAGLRPQSPRCRHRRLDGFQGLRPRQRRRRELFATLKKELVHRRSWPTRRELISQVFAFVEAVYHTTRRHSTLGYLSPAQFEAMTQTMINKENG